MGRGSRQERGPRASYSRHEMTRVQVGALLETVQDSGPSCPFFALLLASDVLSQSLSGCISP